MTDATLVQCNTQLQTSWAAEPAIGKALTGTGEPGATLGNIGDIYFNKTDKTLYGPKTGSGWGSPTSFAGAKGDTGDTGETGAAGADGRTVLNGAGAPSAGTGANGDFYINTTNHSIYGPKAAGAWGSPTSLVGGG
jgi:hypothetical protein